MADQEMESLKSGKPKASQKMTRAQIQADQEHQRLAAQAGELILAGRVCLVCISECEICLPDPNPV